MGKAEINTPNMAAKIVQFLQKNKKKEEKKGQKTPKKLPNSSEKYTNLV